MRKLVASGLSKDDWVVNAEELRFVLEDTTRRTLIAMCELMATAATNPEWKDKTIGEGIARYTYVTRFGRDGALRALPLSPGAASVRTAAINPQSRHGAHPILRRDFPL
jgi:hypothetical protein